MILVDREIKKAIETGELVIEPFIEDNIGPASYDVTLSPHFVYYPPQVFNVYEEPEYSSFRISDDECIILMPPHYDVLYDDVDDMLVFRSKHHLDLYIDPELIHLAEYEKGYAIFSTILASTNEYIKLPEYMSAEYTGRSSLGRMFLQSHQTAGWVDSGFEGTITLELVALDYPVILYPHIKIGQLIFYRHSKCDTPYCRRKSSKYNKQSGATPTRLYMDFEI